MRVEGLEVGVNRKGEEEGEKECDLAHCFVQA